MNLLLFPPALIKRALDDLNAIGDAARRVDGIERSLLRRLDELGAQVERLHEDMDPLKQLSAVRSQLQAVHTAVEPVSPQLDALRDDVKPIQDLEKVRAGIEPLDDDMRQVRQSIDEIEPLVKGIGSRIRGVDEKLARMSGDLAPVGELAEKMPGVKRR